MIKLIKQGFLFSICQTLGGWVEAEEGEGLTRESGQPVENSQVIRCLFSIVCISFISIFVFCVQFQFSKIKSTSFGSGQRLIIL